MYNITINNKDIKNVNSEYFLGKEYILFNVDQIIDSNNDVKIEVWNKTYYIKNIINWNLNNLEYYNNILKNNDQMYINCDLYEEFIPWKILIEKNETVIYIKSIKHYLK